jgi:simple sugar transport system ATP-binding protein
MRDRRLVANVENEDLTVDALLALIAEGTEAGEAARAAREGVDA